MVATNRYRVCFVGSTEWVKAPRTTLTGDEGVRQAAVWALQLACTRDPGKVYLCQRGDTWYCWTRRRGFPAVMVSRIEDYVP